MSLSEAHELLGPEVDATLELLANTRSKATNRDGESDSDDEIGEHAEGTATLPAQSQVETLSEFWVGLFRDSRLPASIARKSVELLLRFSDSMRLVHVPSYLATADIVQELRVAPEPRLDLLNRYADQPLYTRRFVDLLESGPKRVLIVEARSSVQVQILGNDDVLAPTSRQVGHPALTFAKNVATPLGLPTPHASRRQIFSESDPSDERL